MLINTGVDTILGGNFMKNKLLVILILMLMLNTGCEVVSEQVDNFVETVNENISDAPKHVAAEVSETSTEALISENDDKSYVVVERVVDGDTFVTEGGDRVRMILINTPESVHPDQSKNTEFGEIASEYVKKLLQGKKVYLEKDVSEEDRYGRLLRYVYLEDGTFVNELIVKEGFGQIATYPPDVKYKDIILAAEQYARENKKGLWAD